MRLALDAGLESRGSTASNPWVGCVLVRDGAVIATGRTQLPGEAHAEAHALTRIDARGADAYVTLEPCTPFPGKRTPPCAQALIDADVKRVVVALEDPDPAVSGRGIAMLRAAGLEVETGDGREEAIESLRPYLKQRKTGLPHVIAKFAVSTDGKLGAPAFGLRQITGEAARKRAHADRAWVDAILVGIQTVLDDDPSLTARPGGQYATRQPARIVLDSHGRTPETARMLGEPGATVIACSPDAPAAWRERMRSAGAQVLELEPGLNLDQLLAVLGRRGMLSILVEGGGRVLGSFFDGGLVDEVHAYIAPLVIGPSGIPAINGDTSFPMEPLRLLDSRFEALPPDVLLRGFTRGL